MPASTRCRDRGRIAVGPPHRRRVQVEVGLARRPGPPTRANRRPARSATRSASARRAARRRGPRNRACAPPRPPRAPLLPRRRSPPPFPRRCRGPPAGRRRRRRRCSRRARAYARGRACWRLRSARRPPRAGRRAPPTSFQGCVTAMPRIGGGVAVDPLRRLAVEVRDGQRNVERGHLARPEERVVEKRRERLGGAASDDAVERVDRRAARRSGRSRRGPSARSVRRRSRDRPARRRATRLRAPRARGPAGSRVPSGRPTTVSRGCRAWSDAIRRLEARSAAPATSLTPRAPVARIADRRDSQSSGRAKGE